MEKRDLKKMIISGLILMSVVQITQRYIKVSDWIYGGLIGITLGIMLIGLYKMIKLKKHTTNR